MLHGSSTSLCQQIIQKLRRRYKVEGAQTMVSPVRSQYTSDINTLPMAMQMLLGLQQPFQAIQEKNQHVFIFASNKDTAQELTKVISTKILR